MKKSHPGRGAGFVVVLAFGLLAAAAPAVAADTAPTEPQALNQFLQAGSYKNWPKESRPQDARAGAHPGGQIRAWLSPALAKSLADGAKSHPAGSATVKEMFDASGKLRGWSVGVKTAADSAGGKNWFWYEVESTAPGAKPAYVGLNAQPCSACHSTGRDFVLTPFPLR